MRFVSKNSNLTIVLVPGIPAQPLSGLAAKPGLYVRFKGGVVEVKDEETIEKMKAHSAYNRDYIAVEDGATVIDPFADSRTEPEPAHHTAEIKYGHVENPKSSAKKVKVTPEMKKLVNALAMEQVKVMLPEAVKMALAQINEAKKEDKKEDKE